MNLPEKFEIPNDRIPKPFAQGVYGDCVAITFTKILEVINFIKTGEYIPLSKGYMYGRNNRPGKTQGGSDYEYMLNTLLSRGTVPETLCPERDEIPVITEKLAAREDIAELDELAKEYKIEKWEKIPGNIYLLENIKKCLYEHQMPIAGNMTGRIQHCTVIIGWDGDKLIYQDHDKAGKKRSIKGGFNAAYYIDGGIETKTEQEEKNMDYKLMDAGEFKKHLDGLKITRKITVVQLHHTYSPAYKEFNGANHIELQRSMRNYHINTRGFADIAQNFTIFPDGKICVGRDINTAPAGIYGANSNGVCIECVGNFDKGGDNMTEAQKNAIIGAVKILLDKLGLNAKTGVTYHAWWTSGGTNLGTYIAGKSAKTCPGTAFFGGNTKEAYEKNLMPLIEQHGKSSASASLKPVESINDIVWELINAGIVTNGELWLRKCQEDINIYWLCRKMANKLRGTL